MPILDVLKLQIHVQLQYLDTISYFVHVCSDSFLKFEVMAYFVKQKEMYVQLRYTVKILYRERWERERERKRDNSGILYFLDQRSTNFYHWNTIVLSLKQLPVLMFLVTWAILFDMSIVNTTFFWISSYFLLNIVVWLEVLLHVSIKIVLSIKLTIKRNTDICVHHYDSEQMIFTPCIQIQSLDNVIFRPIYIVKKTIWKKLLNYHLHSWKKKRSVVIILCSCFIKPAINNKC